MIQFLLGLNDTYSSIRNNLLMSQPFPNLNVAYFVLLQEENHRSISSLFSDGLLDNTTALFSNYVRSSTSYKGKIYKSGWSCSFYGQKGHSE